MAMAKSICVVSAICVSALLFVPRVAHAAEIKVLSDGPLEAALVKIADIFRQDTGREIKFVFGLSPVIHKRVIEGEMADVIIIQPISKLVN
jgi:molybdate transport system substrate-binding protein